MTDQRRYTRQLVGSMVVYAIVLVGSILIVKANPSAWWRFLVILAPVAPVITAVLAVVDRMRTLDELQQRIQLEALAFAFGTTAVLTFSYGFLEGVGLPHLDWTFVLPLMSALWGIGLLVANRRYR